MSTPVITIFVRHGNDANGKPCKYAGDEFSQLRRLPEALKARLHSPDDSVDFLERLYRLEDPR